MSEEKVNKDRNLLSLELLSVSLDIPQDQPEGIFQKLRKAIENQVKKDGVRKDFILPGELESDVFKRIVDYIFDDVSEFYFWIFDPEDEFGRYQYLQVQPTQGGRFAGSDYNAIKKAVEPVVEDNLDAMREADEITPEQDVEGLSEKITDDLTAYIMNWQDWFYIRRVDDDLDAYYESAAEHADIYRYNDDGYRNMNNSIDDSEYDLESDVPHFS